MKKAVIIIAFVLFAGIAFAEDVTGWQEIKWGMDKTQVFNLYKTTIDQKNPSGFKIIEPYHINTQSFSVYLFFDDNNIIKAVSLRPQKNSEINLIYSEIVELVEAKYGRPTKLSYDELGGKSLEWVTNSGKIEANDMMLIGTYSIVYYPKPKGVDQI